MRNQLFALLLVAAGCNSRGSLVVVTVEAAPGLADVARVRATVSALGASRDFDLPSPAPVATPFTFGIDLPSTASGTIALHVACSGASGAPLGAGDGSAIINPGDITAVTISIEGAPVDGGADLAAPPDLESPRDLEAPDLRAPPDLAPPPPDLARAFTCAVESAPGAANLWTVYGSSASDVYAGGEAATILHSTGNGVWTIQHGTGAHFSDPSMCLFGLLCPGDVRGLWASAPTNVIAVGEKTFGIMASTGSGLWQAQSAPSTVNFWFAVYGTDAAHVWAAGSNSALAAQGGTTWSLYNFTAGSPNEFFGSLWADSPNDLYLGSQINPSGDVYHSTGGNPAPQTNLTDEISSMWGSNAADVYLVIPLIGVHHSIGNGAWFAQAGASAAAGGGMLFAISGSSATNIYAVGESNSGGLIIHYDGAVWSPVYTTPAPDMGNTALEAVWIAPTGDVFSVGMNGSIVHCK